jgi:hypothetical protein
MRDNIIDWVLPEVCYFCGNSPAYNIYRSADGECIHTCDRCRPAPRIIVPRVDPSYVNNINYDWYQGSPCLNNIPILEHQYELVVYHRGLNDR